MDTDTNYAEAGHQEVLIVGAGAPDNALLHLGICPGEPLGDQVPDCGHALLPAPGQSLQSDSRCSAPPHVWTNQWRHPSWRSSFSSSGRAHWQGHNGGPHLGGLVHGVGGGKLLVGIIHGNGNYWFTGSA